MWRCVGFLALSIGLFPIWIVVGPFWLSGGLRATDALGVAAGALLVGILFLLLATRRRKLPSLAFAIVVPLTGVLGFALVAAAAAPFYPSYWYDVASYVYTGVIWCYVLTLPASAGAAIFHAFALRWLGRRIGLVPIGTGISPLPKGLDPPQI